jgi:hypothetical protein
MDTDRLIEQLRALPPDLPDRLDRLEQVHQRVRAQRRRQLTAAVVGGVAALALAVPVALQVLPENAAGPAGQESTVTTTDRSEESAGDLTPGMTRVTAHSEPVTATHTGTATVELGDRPPEATAVSITLDCLSAGEFTWPDGNTMICAAGEATRFDPAMPAHEVALEPGQEQIVIEASEGASWRITTAYVSTEVTAWGVNAKGETYGVENENGTPDLIAVIATNGKPGYAYNEDLNTAGGPEPTSPQDAYAQQEANQGKAFSVPVYEPDGETRIGEFLIGNGRTSTNGEADPTATATVTAP